MPTLGFDYNSSYPDSDPFEPRGGGSCTWLPFFIGNMIEFPMTMPQDHTLFVILRQPDGQAWIDKAEFLRSRGGMVLMDTHPDYLVDERILGAYRGLLERYADDETVWSALPADVSGWWRRRAGSRLGAHQRRMGGHGTRGRRGACGVRIERHELVRRYRRFECCETRCP